MVGNGFRASALLAVAERLPGLECVGVVVRTPRPTALPTFGSVRDCVEAAHPDFLVLAVSWSATPELVREAVGLGVPVLAETPPAGDLEGLRSLWAAVGASGLVQVAEQYLLMPMHAARLALVRNGTIGTPTQVQVSSTQRYHAVSLIRGLLGAGRDPVAVRATRFEAPLVNPLTRAGWTHEDEPAPATTTIATLDFGDGRSGLYDFTDNQTRNLLRFRRLTVRGSAGEVRDEEVVRLVAPETVVRAPLLRRQVGYDVDLNGFDTDHITFDSDVLYRNPYLGQRWMDDEIATAALLERTADWVRGEGPEPYPLADGCQDHAIAEAIELAADEDRTVTTVVEPWA